ncbi:hypothetical protein X975_08279, partial [Stegodyphus mimosarum]
KILVRYLTLECTCLLCKFTALLIVSISILLNHLALMASKSSTLRNRNERTVTHVLKNGFDEVPHRLS